MKPTPFNKVPTGDDEIDRLQDRIADSFRGVDLRLLKGVRLVVDANATVSTGDQYIGMQALSAVRTVLLPDAGPSRGQVVYVKDENGKAATFNIKALALGAGQSLDGSASPTAATLINAAYGAARLISNGQNWYTL